MRAEFIAVGDELLLGDTINTNAARVGAFLAELGAPCAYQTAVGDRRADIAEALRLAAGRADLVVVSGGLGPTPDDLTREAVGDAFGLALHRDPAIEEWLEARFATMGRRLVDGNRQQADVLEGAEVIWPTFGTAPGLILRRPVLIVLLPGVPAELDEMLERALRPILAERADGRLGTETVQIVGIPESEVADRIADLWRDPPAGIDVASLARPGLVRLRFTGMLDDPAVRRSVDALTAAVRTRFGEAVLAAPSLVAEIGATLMARGWTLAVAESLTAGGLGARLTDEPGASAWFRGGVIAYADPVKTELLDVPPALIERFGVVSSEVAVAMADGVRARLRADVGVALTGVAGPGPADAMPAGTVHIAVRTPEVDLSHEMRGGRSREQVRTWAIAAALGLLRRALR